MMRLAIAFALLAASAPLFAGKYNPSLSIGEEAPAWESLPGVDGRSHSLDDVRDAQALVLVFTCNTCPYAVDYESRLIALAERFKDRPVKLIAINSNSGAADDLDAMKTRAMARSFPFAYLKDDSGRIAKAYGATRTPEVVVLDRDRKVAYLGAIDDNPDGKKIGRHYVDEAVQAALLGQTPKVTETPPIGCGIKFPRERRRPSK